jgi:hypothetical protein
MSDDGKPRKLTGVKKTVSIIVVVLVLLLFGALGWKKLYPSKIRATPNEKTVIGNPLQFQTAGDNFYVTNNLRLLATAADQYFLDHGGTSVSLVDLVGTNSTQYIKTFPTVAGETYSPVIVKGQPVTAAGIAGARTITYQ